MHPGARAFRAAVESRRNSNFGPTVPLKLAVGLRWPRRRLMCHRQVIYDPSAAEKVTHDFFSRRLNKGGLAQSVFVQEAGSAAAPPHHCHLPVDYLSPCHLQLIPVFSRTLTSLHPSPLFCPVPLRPPAAFASPLLTSPLRPPLPQQGVRAEPVTRQPSFPRNTV